MKRAVVLLVLLALVGVTACGAGKPRLVATADAVAALLREKWGATQGSPSFDYSCVKLDERGSLFTCRVRDKTDTVELASFDVVCNGSTCRWTVYPAYRG